MGISVATFSEVVTAPAAVRIVEAGEIYEFDIPTSLRQIPEFGGEARAGEQGEFGLVGSAPLSGEQ